VHPNKWDLILDQRPVPLVTHLLEQVAQLFAKDLATWPPAIDDFDPRTGQTVAALLHEHAQPPDPRSFEQAFELARLDLAREHAQYDDYLRNQRWLETGLTAKDKGMVLFLSRFMTEQLLGLAEATQGRLTRAQLLLVLARTQTLFFDKGRAS
jgi:hypothetical protein